MYFVVRQEAGPIVGGMRTKAQGSGSGKCSYYRQTLACEQPATGIESGENTVAFNEIKEGVDDGRASTGVFSVCQSAEDSQILKDMGGG